MQQINTYTGGGLNPAQDEAGALTDAVNLAAGKAFAAGTVLGQIEGTGSAVAEVQTLTGTGTISGGTYRIVFDGQTTAALAYNANNATIQAALEALTNIGTGGVTVGGGAFPGTPVTLTFAGTLAGQAQPLVSIINSLTGTAPVVTPTRTTPGKPAGGYWDAYDDAASGSFAGLATARRLLKYACRTGTDGRIYPGPEIGSGDSNTWQWSTPAYHAGTFKTSDLTGLDANGVADLGKLISGSTSTLSSATTLLRIG